MYYQYYKYWFTSSHTKPTIHQPHTPKYLTKPRCLRLSVDQEGFCGIIIARQSHLHFTFLPWKKKVLVNAWPTWPWNQNSAEFAPIFSSLDGSMICVRNLQSRRFSAKIMRCCFHLFSLRCIIKSVQTNLRENWGTWLSISNQTVDAFVNRTFWDCSSSLSFACDMCLCPSIFYTSPTFSGIRYFGAFGADHIPIHCQYAEKSKISFKIHSQYLNLPYSFTSAATGTANQLGLDLCKSCFVLSRFLASTQLFNYLKERLCCIMIQHILPYRPSRQKHDNQYMPNTLHPASKRNNTRSCASKEIVASLPTDFASRSCCCNNNLIAHSNKHQMHYYVSLWP